MRTPVELATLRARTRRIPAVRGYGHPRLSFQHTLPPNMVHKIANDQVLLTDGIRLGERRFLIAALWPHNHLLYQPSVGIAGDPTLLLESARQAAIYVSHRFYDVPQDRSFVLTSMGAEITAPGLPYKATAPLQVRLDVRVTPTTTAPKRFGMRLEATLTIDGRRRGRVHLAWEALPQRLYDILRSRNCPPRQPSSLPQPLSKPIPPETQMKPATVGRRHIQDVLLSVPSRANTSTLLLDLKHPVYFDHFGDHIPAMALFEAMRQAAHATAATPSKLWTPLSMVASYHVFADFDSPVTLTTTADEASSPNQQPTRLHVTAHQRGTPLCELHLDTQLSPSATAEKEMSQC